MKCLNKVFKVLPYDTDMVAGWFYIRLWFRDNLWTSTSRTYVEQSCTIFQFHRKIYWPLYSLGSEKLILWARLCCNSDRRCGSVSSCAYRADRSSVALSVLSQPWLSPEQAGNDNTFWDPASPQREPSSERDVVIKQRDGNKVWSRD